MNITFTMIETVLLSAILVGCHSYSNPIHPYPLYIAKTPELAKLLIEHGANVDGNGVCPICNAAVDSNIELFKVLYKAGASITLTGRFASVEQTLLDCHKIMNDRPSKDLPQCLQMEEIIRSGR